MPITPSPAVLRAADVLDALSAAPERGLTVSALSRLAGVPRATCDAVLLALAERGLVARDDDRRYTLGTRCIALGDAARAGNSLLRLATVQIESVGRRLGACAAVTLLDGEHVTVVQVADHGPPFAISTRLGQTITLRAPFGAVFVAWEGEAAVARWLDDPDLDDDARHRFRLALADVRRRGYSVGVTAGRPAVELAPTAADGGPELSMDGLVPGLRGTHRLALDLGDDEAVQVNQLSVPIFDRSGHVLASIMVLGPHDPMTGAEVRSLGALVLEAADRVTDAVGGARPAPPRSAAHQTAPGAAGAAG